MAITENCRRHDVSARHSWWRYKSVVGRSQVPVLLIAALMFINMLVIGDQVWFSMKLYFMSVYLKKKTFLSILSRPEKVPNRGRFCLIQFTKLSCFIAEHTSTFRLPPVDIRKLQHSPTSCYYAIHVPVPYLGYCSIQIRNRDFKFAQI
jgi:hypothetical protein